MKVLFQAPWSTRETVSVLVTTTALLVMAISGLYLSDLRDFVNLSTHRIFYVLGVFILQSVLMLLPLFTVTARHYHLRLSNFGFNKECGLWRTIQLVIKGYAIYLIITFLVTAFILYTNLRIPGYQVNADLLEIFGTSKLELIIAFIVTVILAPLVEEIFFRGFLLRSLVDKVGVWPGTVLVAALFATFHMQWQSVIPIFILGLIINYLMLRSRSIYPAILFHAFNNLIALILQILLIKNIIPIEDLI